MYVTENDLSDIGHELWTKSTLNVTMIFLNKTVKREKYTINIKIDNVPCQGYDICSNSCWNNWARVFRYEGLIHPPKHHRQFLESSNLQMPLPKFHWKKSHYFLSHCFMDLSGGYLIYTWRSKKHWWIYSSKREFKCPPFNILEKHFWWGPLKVYWEGLLKAID